MSENEKEIYLNKELKHLYTKKVYIKREKINKNDKDIDNEYEFIDTEITLEEAQELASIINDDNFVSLMYIGPQIVIEGGGGGGGTTVGPTYNAVDDHDIEIRVLTISCSYNYTYDEMFVKATVEWMTMPIDRGWDLITLAHTENAWYIDTVNIWNSNTMSYDQEIRFTGKQIYAWTEFDNELYPYPYTGSTTTNSIYYDEDDTEYYKSDVARGITLKQNLKNDEITVNSCDYWGCHVYGNQVTELQLSLEADFDNIGENGFGVFYASSLHQETYTTINIEDISITYTAPYVSVPLGIFEWGRKYEEDGLAISINVPID